MRLNHPDYIKLVTEAYKKKRTSNQLSPLLAQSTLANIRRECANIYQERYEKKDEPALRAFFGPGEHGRKFLAVIQSFPINRFKSLDQYIKGDGKKGLNDTNLNLLAWLIDFQHRPYTFGMDVLLSDLELTVIKNDGPIIIIPQPEEGKLGEEIESPTNELVEIMTKSPILINEDPKTDSPKKRYRKAVLILLILVICTGGIYAVWQHKQNTQIVLGNTNSNCMYWSEDHYEKVSCNEKGKGLIYPLNEEKIKSFRKIKLKDTITEWSIGKLYYIQNNKDIECYTEGGIYPENPTRILKVLSRHIYDKYLGKKNPDKDSLITRK